MIRTKAALDAMPLRVSAQPARPRATIDPAPAATARAWGRRLRCANEWTDSVIIGSSACTATASRITQITPAAHRRPGPEHPARGRLAERDLDFTVVYAEFQAFCARRRLPARSTRQLERAWDAWQAGRYRRGEISQWPYYGDNPFRPR